MWRYYREDMERYVHPLFKIERGDDAEMMKQGARQCELSLQDAEGWVKGRAFYRVGDRTTVCCLTLANGYEVVGMSACVLEADFNETLGNKYAYQDALKKVVELMAFLERDTVSSRLGMGYCVAKGADGPVDPGMLLLPYEREEALPAHRCACERREPEQVIMGDGFCGVVRAKDVSLGVVVDTFRKEPGWTRAMRSGWNGKNMWIQAQYPDEWSKNTLPYVYIEYPKGHPAYPDGCRVPWLASQTDLFAQDWTIIQGIVGKHVHGKFAEEGGAECAGRMDSALLGRSE